LLYYRYKQLNISVLDVTGYNQKNSVEKESNIGKYYSTFNKPDGVWYEFTWDVPYSEEGGPTQAQKKKELRDKKIDSIF